MQATKITKGTKTFVVLVDDNGVEHGRCGGARAERAKYALVGRQWHRVATVAGPIAPEVEANQQARPVTEYAEAGRVTLPAGTSAAEFDDLRDRLNADGHGVVKLLPPGRFDFPHPYATRSEMTLTADAEVAFGDWVVEGYEIYEFTPHLVGLRKDSVTPNADGRVGYERVDAVLRIC